MTTTTDEAALLAAIHANPDDDTVRLVYADCLTESGEPERMDRAELIRVQISVMNLEADVCMVSPREMPACQDKLDSSRHHEATILARYPDWLRVTCPACDGNGAVRGELIGIADCPFCSGTGHLPLVFRRGFPWRVTVPRLAQVGDEGVGYCSACIALEKARGTTTNHPRCGKCDGGRVRVFRPTTPARELLRSLPTCGELVPGDRKPMEHEGKYAFVCGVLDHPCGLPESLWRAVHRDGPHPTADAAISALGVTMCDIVRSVK